MNIEFKTIIALVSVLMTVVGYFFYFRDIFRGTTNPHAFSWLVWASLTGIAFAAQVTGDGGPGAWTTLVTAVISAVIFLLALKKGEHDITRSDWLNLVGAGIAMGIWVFTDDPLLSVVLITIIDFLGFVPTIRKSYAKPYEETLIHYELAGLKFVFAIAALNSYSLITWLYPASLVAANLLFVIILIVRRKQIRPVRVGCDMVVDLDLDIEKNKL